MKKTLLETYALVVCFSALFSFIIVLAMTLYSVIQIADPTLTMNSNVYAQYQSNDLFWGECGNRSLERYRPSCSDADMKKVRPDEVKLTKQREEEFALKTRMERRDGTQSVMKLLIIMLVTMFTFGVHWLIARRARE